MQHFAPLIFSTVTWNLNADHVPQLLKTNTPERLSEDISQLLLCLRVTEDNPALINTLPNEMVTNINVLAPVVEDGVPAESYGRLVVHQELWRAKLPPNHIGQESSEPHSLTSRSRCSDILRFTRR